MKQCLLIITIIVTLAGQAQIQAMGASKEALQRAFQQGYQAAFKDAQAAYRTAVKESEAAYQAFMKEHQRKLDRIEDISLAKGIAAGTAGTLVGTQIGRREETGGGCTIQ